MTLFFLYDKMYLVMSMKNRSELREISMQAIYQIYIYESSNIEYELNKVIKELLEVENPFVNELTEGVISKQDEISKIAEAIKIARKTMKIVKQNIAFALVVKILVLLLSAFGFANMWLAVFADVGVSMIAILNSMRTLQV